MRLEEKIVGLPEAKKIVAEWKGEGKKVCFTNGVFDILHAGHVKYLAEARRLGDRLVLGLNTDSSVKKIKGPSRPIQDENDRAIILAGLWAVDLIVLFSEETPYNLIVSLMPDVLIKGGDYTFDTIVGAPEVIENGGEVRTINFVEGKSTTNIIGKINLI
jgi:rfaE bifunctional protein nucleotidyltransferase chain/domain